MRLPGLEISTGKKEAERASQSPRGAQPFDLTSQVVSKKGGGSCLLYLQAACDGWWRILSAAVEGRRCPRSTGSTGWPCSMDWAWARGASSSVQSHAMCCGISTLTQLRRVTNAQWEPFSLHMPLYNFFSLSLSVSLLKKEKCFARPAWSWQNLEQRRILCSCHISQHLCHSSDLFNGKFPFYLYFVFLFHAFLSLKDRVTHSLQDKCFLKAITNSTPR